MQDSERGAGESSGADAEQMDQKPEIDLVNEE
jgi:hypothetical protein